MIIIKTMKRCAVSEYAKLYMSVFNHEPWNDSWTVETASVRIANMMKTSTFVGKAMYRDGVLLGLIWGQKEQYDLGIHFQIQEFCVGVDAQGKGYGTLLLDELRTVLQRQGITNIYLITSKGQKTEGFYQRKGFQTSDNMVLMYQVQ